MGARADWTQPQHCHECDRLLRPVHARAADWPGTAQAANMAGRLCHSCARAARRAGRACRPRTAVPTSPRARGPVTVRELMEAGAACVSAPSAEHMAMVRRVTSQW